MTRNEAKDRVVDAARKIYDEFDGTEPFPASSAGELVRQGYPSDKDVCELGDALALLDATPDSEGGWRPIETLPRDVTHCWIGHEPSSTMLVAQRTAGNRDWRIMWAVGRTLMWEPTHWMPLPAPPSQEQK